MLTEADVLKRTVHIGELNPRVSTYDIKIACSSFGTVLNVQIESIPDNGSFALVEFETTASADSLWVMSQVLVASQTYPVTRALRPAIVNDPPDVIFGRYLVVDREYARFTPKRFEQIESAITLTVQRILARINNSG